MRWSNTERTVKKQPDLRDNADAERFEAAVDGQVAILVYERKPDALVLIHTEVPTSLRGRGIGEALVKFALAAAKGEGRRVVPLCPFVRAYLQKHPEAAPG